MGSAAKGCGVKAVRDSAIIGWQCKGRRQGHDVVLGNRAVTVGEEVTEEENSTVEMEMAL